MYADITLSSPHKSPNYQQKAQAMQHGYNSQSTVEKPNVQNEGTRKIAINFLESPSTFPECIRNNVSWMSKEAGLTDLENQMKQTEFAAGHLIDIEIPIDSLLLKRKQQHGGVEIENETKVQNVLYHYAVAVSLSNSLFEVGNDERPHPHDVADDLHKKRHRQLPSNDGKAKTRSGHHPVAMFGPLQSRDNEFRHGEGIQRPKDGRQHLLQTALEETQVENRVFHQLVRVPTSQVLLVSVCQHMRPARNCNKGRRTANRSYNRPEHRYLVCSIDCEAVNNIYSHPMESAVLPRSNEGPHCLATLFELQAIK